MEKRPQKTLARTLPCGANCAKLALALTLFLPALMGSFMSGTQESAPPVVSPASAVEEIQRPKELMQIFSIVRSHRPDVAESENWRLSEVIHEETSKRHLDPLMVLALIRVESGFQAAAVSPAGARGIMQIMPDTGRNLAGEYGFHPAGFTAESLDDPVLNLRLGIYYLHGLKGRFQNWSVALTAYNFGPIDTQNRIDNNLDLSEDFAVLVLNAYQRYKSTRHPAF
jgi:soluble lytic murein transglycosylase-like protein